jgi:hypothetical protein
MTDANWIHRGPAGLGESDLTAVIAEFTRGHGVLVVDYDGAFSQDAARKAGISLSDITICMPTPGKRMVDALNGIAGSRFAAVIVSGPQAASDEDPYDDAVRAAVKRLSPVVVVLDLQRMRPSRVVRPAR